MTQIALYARVSCDQQKKESTIASQIDSLKDYLIQNEMRLDEDLVFMDDGVSGANLERPGLDRLRDKSLNGLIDKVVVLCPDRLARKHSHQLVLIEEFGRFGVEIIFANHEVSSSPEGQLLLQIQGVISEYEREKIIERSRRGKIYKAKKGCVNVLNGAPYGYNYIKKSADENARYEINLVEAKVVRDVFKKYTVEGLSIGGIARWLNGEQIPTRKQVGRWERSTVWGMLKNPSYMGKAAYRKTQLVDRQRPTKLAIARNGYSKNSRKSCRPRPKEQWITIPVPPLIDEKTYHIVSEKLVENKKLSSRNNLRHQYLLSGILRCIECGYSVYGVSGSSGPKKRLYYRCQGQDAKRRLEGKVCSQHPVRVEVLDDTVWDQVKKLIKSPELVFEEYSDRTSKKRNIKETAAAAMIKKEKFIKTQEIEKERLLNLYQKGILGLDEIEGRLKQIRKKIKDSEAEINILQSELKSQSKQLQVIEQLESFTKTIANKVDSMNFLEKKKLVRLLISEVLIDVKNTDITVRHIIPVKKIPSLCTGSV